MKKRTILFVDDEENILNSLKRSLFDEEYRCIFTISAEEALNILNREEVHVVVADMKMPQMDGLTFLKIVKEKYPKIVRIVLSGYTQLSQVLATINQADVFRYVTKPWKMEEEFKEILKQAIEYYNLQEEKEELTKALEKKNQMYINILKTTEQKFKEVGQDFLYINNAISKLFDYIIEKKNDDNFDTIIANFKRIFKNIISSQPTFKIKFGYERLRNEIYKFIEEKLNINKKLILNVRNSDISNIIFEGNYTIIFLTLIEIISILYNVNSLDLLQIELTYAKKQEEQNLIFIIPIDEINNQNTLDILEIAGIFIKAYNGDFMIKQKDKGFVLIIDYKL
ncbi:response regulator [Caldicellulosiruptoraceae bacterium PP1]